VIGGTHAVGHGELHAVLLPYVAAYNADATDAMAAVAEALGTTDAPIGLRHLAEELGAPTDLASIGVPEAALDDVVARAVDAVGDRNPRPLDAAALRRMLADAHAGRPPGRY
jgi:alcohol dehydrogenase class IV